MKKYKIIAAVAAIALVGVACSEGDKAREEEQTVSREQLDQFLQAQPIPRFNTSQLRQNLIEIQTAQANATATTSFFFNLGVTDPVHTCPSIGFPIPGTYQLTNPEQVVGHRESKVGIPQLEATGVYTGDTAATTVICVDSVGRGYAFYWEGFVSTVAGPAEWDADASSVRLVGEPTGEFTTGDG